MKILSHLKSGALRSLKTWKSILIIWFIFFVLIGIIAASAKSGLKSMIGSSMITELLEDTINADVIADLRDGLSVLVTSVTKGFFLLIMVTFIANAFFSGGLFNILRKECSRKSLICFFKGGVSNFRAVLVINIIVSLIFIAVVSIIGGIPAMIASKSGSGNPEPGTLGKTIRISMVIVALLLPVLLLVADYARAWLTGNDSKKPFSAIGKGFTMTFKTFVLSYPVMMILIITQALFGFVAVSKLIGATPSGGGGVFLLFLISQLLFIIRLFLRTWRYGSITSMLEGTAATMVAQDQSEQVAEPLLDRA